MKASKRAILSDTSDESFKSASASVYLEDTTSSDESTITDVPPSTTTNSNKKPSSKKPPHSKTKTAAKKIIISSKRISKSKPINKTIQQSASSTLNKSSSTVTTSQICTRSRNKPSFFITRDEERTDTTFEATTSIRLKMPTLVIHEQDLPKAVAREFTVNEDSKRKEEQTTTSENLNFISRGRLMVLNRLKALHLHVPDAVDRKSCNLLKNDIQQIQDYIDNEDIKNKYHFASILFIEEIKTEDIFNEFKRNNKLLINYPQKFYSSEEHATTNLCVPALFRADFPHSSVRPISGLRASLQIQFECDNGISTPLKPRSDIVPMHHDLNDPLFDFVRKLVEESLENHLKSPKIVANFAANNHKNEWYIFDSKGRNKLFALKLKESYDRLKKARKLSGSFTEFLYCYWNIRNHNIKDVRIVFIGGNLAVGPHTDTGHLNSSDNSVTLHMNAWNSSDYIPGNTSSGCWAEPSEYINWWNTDGYISGKLGELDCWFDKATFKFVFMQELEHVKTNVTMNAFSKQPCPKLIQKIKSHNDLDEDPDITVTPYKYVPIVRSHGKSTSKGKSISKGKSTSKGKSKKK